MWQTICVVHASVFFFSWLQDRSVEKVVILFAVAKGKQLWIFIFRARVQGSGSQLPSKNFSQLIDLTLTFFIKTTDTIKSIWRFDDTDALDKYLDAKRLSQKIQEEQNN